MALTVVTPPTATPVSLDDIRLHCRIDIEDDDPLIFSWIREATDIVQQRADRTLCTTTWKLTLDGFPCTILLPRPPIVSVSSIKYFDAGGTQQTLSPTMYKVDTVNNPARIVPAYGQSWPTVRAEINAVEVTYVAGYGTASTVPDAAKAAIRLLCAHRNENREPVNSGNITTPLPESVDALIAHLYTGMMHYPGVG